MFLNTFKSAERSRFDAAHELAHLILHKHGAPNGQEAEKQADTFAGSFLMPRASVLASAPRSPTISAHPALKAKMDCIDVCARSAVSRIRNSQ